MSSHKFAGLKTCFHTYQCSQPTPMPTISSDPSPGDQSTSTPYCQPLPGQTHPSPTSSHPSPLLGFKISSLYPSVNLHPCKMANLNPPHTSPHSGHLPACSQIHPSPPSGHPPPLLAVKFIPPQPAVILHPCHRSKSPFPAQRSSSTPAGGQNHPSLLSSYRGIGYFLYLKNCLEISHTVLQILAQNVSVGHKYPIPQLLGFSLSFLFYISKKFFLNMFF